MGSVPVDPYSRQSAAMLTYAPPMSMFDMQQHALYSSMLGFSDGMGGYPVYPAQNLSDHSNNPAAMKHNNAVAAASVNNIPPAVSTTASNNVLDAANNKVPEAVNAKVFKAPATSTGGDGSASAARDIALSAVPVGPASAARDGALSAVSGSSANGKFGKGAMAALRGGAVGLTNGLKGSTALVQGVTKGLTNLAGAKKSALLKKVGANTEIGLVGKSLVFLHFCIYMVVGIIGYTYGEDGGEDEDGWSAIDGLYFTMMTMSTVGYGDISPSNTGMRVFTLFMIFWGIILIFPSIAAAVTPFTGPVQRKLQDWLEFQFPAEKLDLEGDGSEEYEVPRAPLVYYFKQLFPSVFMNIIIQLVSAGIFLAIEETWGYFDAVYHCFVTATTVGYGDQTIETQDGRLWASFHMAISVILLGEMIGRIDDARSNRKAQLSKIEQLKKRLDDDLLLNMLQRMKELRPGLDHAGVTELEFAICMMLELGELKTEQLTPFIKQFRALDVDHSGTLNQDDILAIKRLADEQLEAKATAENGAV